MFNSTLTYTRIAMLIASVLGGTATVAWAGYVVGHQTFIHTVVDMLAPPGASIVQEGNTSITIHTAPMTTGDRGHTITYTVDLSSAPTPAQRERLGLKGDEHCSIDATLENGFVWVANDQKTKSQVKRYEFDGFPDASVAQCEYHYGSGFCSIWVAGGAVCYIGTGKCDVLLMLGPRELKVLAYIQANYCSGLAISRPY